MTGRVGVVYDGSDLAGGGCSLKQSQSKLSQGGNLTILWKILFPILVASGVVASSTALLRLLAPPGSFKEGTDGVLLLSYFVLFWTLAGVILAGWVRHWRLNRLRETHPLSWPAHAEECLKSAVLGGGAAGGAVAIMVTFIQRMIDYVLQSGAEPPPALQCVVYIGLVGVFFALWALAYSVQDALLKPPKIENKQRSQQGDLNT